MAPDKTITSSKSKELKSSSVPSTPQPDQKHKRTASSSQELDKNVHSSNTTPVITAQGKHIPNYLRPTISSVKSSGKNHQQSESSTLPPATNKKPVNKHLPPPRKLPNSALPRSPRSTVRTQIHRKPTANKVLTKATKKQVGTSKSTKNNTVYEDELEEVSMDIESKTNDEKDTNFPSEEQMFHYDASEESIGGGDEMTSDDGSSVRSRLTENESRKVNCEEENKEVKEVDTDDKNVTDSAMIDLVIKDDCEEKNKVEEVGTDVIDHARDVESSDTDNATKMINDMDCKEKKKEDDVATDVKNIEEEKERLNANNAVIEETASKLAEKKNKVLALAGAFETVISLQEPKGQPSPKKVESRTSVHETQHKDERRENIVKNDQESNHDESSEANIHEEDRENEVDEGIDLDKQKCQEEKENLDRGAAGLNEEKSNEINMSSDEKRNDAEELKSPSPETKEENTKGSELV